MGRSRKSFVGFLIVLIVGMMAVPAVAQDRQDIDDFESGVVRDFEGDRDEFCADYPAGDCLLVIAEAFGPECESDIPLFGYRVRLGPAVESDTVDVTFINPQGADAAYPAQPLSGELLWPGADLGDDGEVDWPGWTLTDNGWILTDEAGLTFAASGVEVLFEVDPTTSIRVAAPDLTAEPCVDDPEVLDTSLTRDTPTAAPGNDDAQVLGVTLALTGGSVALLALLAVVLVGAGFLLLRLRRSIDGA